MKDISWKKAAHPDMIFFCDTQQNRAAYSDTATWNGLELNMHEQLIQFLSRFLSDERLQLIEEKLRSRTRQLVLVLEDIYQSQNGAACLRSAEAFGLQDVHIIENSNKFARHKNIQRGAEKWLTIHRYNKLEQNTQLCLEKLKSAGYQLVATTPQSKRLSYWNAAVGYSKPPPSEIPATNLQSCDLSRKTALLIGTEKTGLSDCALQLADCSLTIPTCGFTESLNLSASTAICLQALSQRLRNLKIDWQLTTTEQQRLRYEWIRKTIGYRADSLEAEFARRRE